MPRRSFPPYVESLNPVESTVIFIENVHQLLEKFSKKRGCKDHMSLAKINYSARLARVLYSSTNFLQTNASFADL